MISGAYKSEFADKKQFDVVAKKVSYRLDLICVKKRDCEIDLSR